MSLLKFLKPMNALPREDTGLSEHVIQEADKNVQKEQEGNQAPPAKKWRKYTTIFSPEDRAEIKSTRLKMGNRELSVNKASEGAQLTCLI